MVTAIPSGEVIRGGYLMATNSEWATSNSEFVAFKFGFYFLFRGIHDDRATLAKYELLHFHETEQVAMTDVSGINLVNLALACKYNFVDSFC